MIKNMYKNSFVDDDFLTVMPEDKMITSAGIARRVGCSHETARNRLDKLAKKEKVRRIEVIDGRDVIWQKV